MTPPNASNNEKLDHSNIAGGKCTKVQPLWKNSWAVSYKTNHVLIICPSNWTLGHLFQRNKNKFTHKKLYTNIHSSFIQNSYKLQTTQMPFNEWMLKHTEMSWTTYSAVRMNHQYVYQFGWISRDSAEWKKANSIKLHTVYNCLYKFLKWQNFGKGR